jgi:Ca2+-binding RTX toxin-like protein
LVGSEGNDLLLGGDGDELIFTLAGRDVVLGGRGNDAITLTTKDTGAAVVYAGNGDNNVDAANNSVGDFVDCGPGVDSLVLDGGLDDHFNCENLTPL